MSATKDTSRTNCHSKWNTSG